MEVITSISFGEQSTNDNFVHEETTGDLSQEITNVGQELPNHEEEEEHGTRGVEEEEEEHGTRSLEEEEKSRRSAEMDQDAVQVVEISRFEEMQEFSDAVTAEVINGSVTVDVVPEKYDHSFLLPAWNLRRAIGPVSPVADMRGVDSLNYSNAEKRLRCKLAASYRLLDVLGWSDGVSATISAVTGSRDILTSPVGILHHEVTASGLVKTNIDGDVKDLGSTGLDADHYEVGLHSAIYKGRDDIQCILHIASPAAVSFSILKCGLLPLCPEAMELGEVTYSDYFGPISSQEDQTRLGLVLNPNSKVMFLRGFGFVVCGESVEQTFHFAQNVMHAMETQMKIMPFGLAYFHIPSTEKQNAVFSSVGHNVPDVVPTKIDRRVEDVVFEGLMRMLDNAGYQTGYTYRHLQSSKRTLRSASMMDVAPSSSKYSAADQSSRTSEHGRSMLVESSRSVTPGSYRPERPERVRTCKSVMENDQSRRTTANLQFVPMGTDVREYVRKVREIRKDLAPGAVSSGPQSNVLEGMTWEEAQRIQASRSCAGDVDAGPKVAAASRGIIQREHQKEAIFYKDYTAVNPFEAISQREIDSYMAQVQRKAATPEPPNISVGQTVEKSEVLPQTRTEKATVVQKDTYNQTPANIKSEGNRTERDEKQSGETKVKPSQEMQSISLNESSSKETGTSSVQKNEQTNGVDAAAELSSAQQMAKPGNTEKVSPVKEDNSASSPVSAPAATKSEEQKPLELVQHSESAVSDSQPSKLQKSFSVKEGKSKKQEELASAEENASKDVEMRTKEKDKKKKRGLSAIFSKKKGS